jgi:hypothetical protein
MTKTEIFENLIKTNGYLLCISPDLPVSSGLSVVLDGLRMDLMNSEKPDRRKRTKNPKLEQIELEIPPVEPEFEEVKERNV